MNIIRLPRRSLISNFSMGITTSTVAFSQSSPVTGLAQCHEGSACQARFGKHVTGAHKTINILLQQKTNAIRTRYGVSRIRQMILIILLIQSQGLEFDSCDCVGDIGTTSSHGRVHMQASPMSQAYGYRVEGASCSCQVTRGRLRTMIMVVQDDLPLSQPYEMDTRCGWICVPYTRVIPFTRSYL